MIRIKVADESEREDLYRIRHDVFVGGGWYPARPDGRLTDDYDDRPSTLHLVGIKEGQVCGGLRLTPYEGGHSAASDLFDFGPHVDLERTLAASMYCVAEWARASFMGFALVRMTHFWVWCHGWSHIVAPSNPAHWPLHERSGAISVTEPFRDARTGLPVLPIVWHIERLGAFWTADGSSRRCLALENTFCHEFYNPEEIVFERGAPGREAYVVVEGEVGLETPLGIVRLGPGEMFGALALLGDGARVATCRATMASELMVVESHLFERQLLGDPEGLAWLLGVLSRRLASQMGAPGGRPAVCRP